jgi:hypothetical protein
MKILVGYLAPTEIVAGDPKSVMVKMAEEWGPSVSLWAQQDSAAALRGLSSAASRQR